MRLSCPHGGRAHRPQPARCAIIGCRKRAIYGCPQQPQRDRYEVVRPLRRVVVSRDFHGLLGPALHPDEDLQRWMQHRRLLHEPRRDRYAVLCESDRLRHGPLVGMVARPLDASLRHRLHQTSTRDCNAGCNTGNCEETEQRLARGTQPRDCQWGSWGNCNCTPSTTDASNAGTQSRSQAVAPGCGGAPCTGSSRRCTVAANNCPVVPVCGTCNCTPSIFDEATAGVCAAAATTA